LTNERFRNLIYLYTLLRIDGIGPQKILSLLSKFQNFENIFSANQYTLSETIGIRKNLAQRIINAAKSFCTIEEEVEKTIINLSKLNANIVTYWDASYPELLKRIYYPPLILYTLGNFSEKDNTPLLSLEQDNQLNMVK
jgi:DNA processing protein